MAPRAYFDISAGDVESHFKLVEAHEQVKKFLSENAATYSLPEDVERLDDEQKDILREAFVARFPTTEEPQLDPPPSLSLGRLTFSLSPSPSLSKTTSNFLSLCSGEKGKMKKAPYKELSYKGSPIHRIVRGFVAQGGDITRGDGSGGESIYGGKFNDEKEGLKADFELGTLAMANSGKNSNTSQYFICLTSSPTQLKKLNGKYVVFGKVVDGMEVLERLDGVGGNGSEGKTRERVWVEDCGVLGSN